MCVHAYAGGMRREGQAEGGERKGSGGGRGGVTELGNK